MQNALTEEKMKKPLMQKLGLLGLVSLLSYTAAVLFSPLAYPGYDWMAQAVSDLCADNAPSRVLWNQLAALYTPCGVVCCTMVCIFVSEKLTGVLRTGISLFAVMNWVSAVGYAMFPLAAAGTPEGLQNTMHLIVTAAVVLLSIVSLIVIIIGGLRGGYRSLAAWAALALLLMVAGAVGTNLVPAKYFGIPERFSVFAAAGFNAVLGVYLYRGRICSGFSGFNDSGI
jgi:hypothetical membrane protein